MVLALLKAKREGLIAKKVRVIPKKGKPYERTVWVRENSEKSEKKVVTPRKKKDPLAILQIAGTVTKENVLEKVSLLSQSSYDDLQATKGALQQKVRENFNQYRLAKQAGRELSGLSNEAKRLQISEAILDAAIQRKQERADQESIALERPGPRIQETSPLKQHFTPEAATWGAIQAGDMDVLAGWIDTTFWKQDSMEERQAHYMVNSFPKTAIEGFTLEDVAQEAFISLLAAQRKGKLQNVPTEKAASYVATVVRNLANDLARQARSYGNNYKQYVTDMSIWADEIEGGKSAEQEYIASIDQGKVQADVRDTLRHISKVLASKKPEIKQIWELALQGKKFREIAASFGSDVEGNRLMTENHAGKAFRSLFRREVMPFLKKRGYSGSEKGMWKEFRKIHQTYMASDDGRYKAAGVGPFRVKVLLQNGKLLLKANREKLVKKEITNKQGKRQVVWVNPNKATTTDKEQAVDKRVKEGAATIDEKTKEANKKAVKGALKDFIKKLADYWSSGFQGQGAAGASVGTATQATGENIKQPYENQKQAGKTKESIEEAGEKQKQAIKEGAVESRAQKVADLKAKREESRKKQENKKKK